MGSFLNWPDWEETSVIEEDLFDGYPTKVVARYLPTLEQCPRCEVGPLKPHGSLLRKYTDAPVRGHPVKIHVRLRRYLCASCGASPMQTPPQLLPDTNMTVRLSHYLNHRSLTVTIASLAKETALNEQIVSAVAKHRPFDPPLLHWPTFAPLILGIDEVTVAGKLRAIFTDLYNHRVLGLIESNRPNAVLRWLNVLATPSRTMVVCIDGYAPYLKPIRRAFGNSIHIVYDKWHVLKAVNYSLSKLSKRGVKRILLKRSDKLTAAEVARRDTELARDPDLDAAYRAKEDFYALYKLKTRLEAERALAKWESSLTDRLRKGFKSVLSKLASSREEILSLWDHPTVTAGFTEAMNGQVKHIIRNGRGYSFPELKRRFMQGYTPAPRDPAKEKKDKAEKRKHMLACPQCRERALEILAAPTVPKTNINA
jgi:transposase